MKYLLFILLIVGCKQKEKVNFKSKFVVPGAGGLVVNKSDSASKSAILKASVYYRSKGYRVFYNGIDTIPANYEDSGIYIVDTEPQVNWIREKPYKGHWKQASPKDTPYLFEFIPTKDSKDTIRRRVTMAVDYYNNPLYFDSIISYIPDSAFKNGRTPFIWSGDDIDNITANSDAYKDSMRALQLRFSRQYDTNFVPTLTYNDTTGTISLYTPKNDTVPRLFQVCDTTANEWGNYNENVYWRHGYEVIFPFRYGDNLYGANTHPIYLDANKQPFTKGKVVKIYQ